MTVAELIKALQDCDPDMLVYIESSDGEYPPCMAHTARPLLLNDRQRFHWPRAPKERFVLIE